jgi:hypothetical protein
MKLPSLVATVSMMCLGGVTATRADLTYDFLADAQGFQNVTWQTTGPSGWPGSPGTVKQIHTAGGWQMQLTKEFAWGPGGGDANQQTAMQAFANMGDRAHLKFDVMVNGSSFPAGAANWFQFNVVGNSDGAHGWTQNGNIFTASGWHNADDPTLVSMHFDQPFSYFGWEPGDTWFQFHTGANSDNAFPVNFFLDNVVAYAVPEPSTLTLLGVGALALWVRRRN